MTPEERQMLLDAWLEAEMKGYDDQAVAVFAIAKLLQSKIEEMVDPTEGRLLVPDTALTIDTLLTVHALAAEVAEHIEADLGATEGAPVIKDGELKSSEESEWTPW